ncbi:conserved repeat domain-containing protein [Sphingomonas gellani]|uniref:Conserved repeat domain-containing protein n=1 Tax=Sphingomonas gellani TaxID=1166340 RepID=A0A1H8B2F5_9SPHN|nr:DUF11 domain-containing protein [Sphingomonas gellani]SEM76933.1 conserved repeat domain-containing protein [Sphingomonas gellani]
MMNRILSPVALLAGTGAGLLIAPQALAQQVRSGTAAGVSISNQATVSYSVGGSSLTTSSNTATFVVDKKINLAVAELGGTPTIVARGATDQVTTFTVTNLTNATQDFRLEADQQDVSIPLLGTDDFNVTSVRVFVDSNGNGTYEAGVDRATFIDELAPDATVTVFIVANIPDVAGITQANVSLNAIAANSGQAGTLGGDVVATPLTTPDSPTTVDIVFADDTGLLDQPRNGQQRAFDAYRLGSAVVTLRKSARVLSDPVNGLASPHAIPGAVVEYCITVNNAGPNVANGITVTDALPANTDYISNSLTVGGIGTGDTCVLNGSIEDDDAVGADESDPYGGSFDGATVRATLPSVTPLVPLNVGFRVTIR